MRLRLISEIQRKWPTTNMDRTNVTGAMATPAINDYLHTVHDGDGHAQNQISTSEGDQEE